MNRFAIGMRTARRAQSYLGETLSNLKRGGMLRTHIEWTLAVCDSHGDGESVVRGFSAECGGLGVGKVRYWHTGEIPNLNAAAALYQAASMGLGWVLFLEDDIDVCDDFVESVDAWLRDVSSSRYRVYPLGAAYSGVRECQGPGWNYPVDKFYGTQAFVIRQLDAMHLADWIVNRQPSWGSTQGFDMMLKAWHKEKYPTLEYLMAAAPNFIQHLGEVSTMNPGKFFQYVSWPGRDWSYYRKRSGDSIWSLKERSAACVSPRLATGLSSLLPKCQPVFDLGCGEGYYVRELKALGYHAHGFDGTPGLGSADQSVADITDVMPEPEQLVPGWKHRNCGSVLCLEVAEHIPQSLESRLIDNIDRYCADLLVLSWAVPGQGGKRHVNERDSTYVIQTLTARGFMHDEAASEQLRTAGGQDCWWFKKSVYVFRRAVTR